MSATILVTGPTGKVGRRLIPLLARRRLTVRAASRSPVVARAGIEPIRFDWTDESNDALLAAGAPPENGRELEVFEGDLDAFRAALIANGAPAAHAPAMVRYFAKVSAGVYEPTDTAARVLGHPPRAYAD